MRINENIFISSLTTMRLGGLARYVIEIESPEEIPEAYGFASANHLPVFILGYGANTIGHDEGFPGIIIINRMRGIFEENTMSMDDSAWNPQGRVTTLEGDPQNVLQSKNFGGGKVGRTRPEGTATGPVQTDPPHTIKIMGGENWDDVVAYACDRGLTGIEALSKIPGLTGAAPVQNIGAYGQEIADTLESIDVYDTVNHNFQTLSKSELNFAYRQSLLNTTARGRYFVISITLALRPGQMPRPFYNAIENYIDRQNITDFSPASIRAIVSDIRAEKLPDPLTTPSAGSFFKNVYVDNATAEKLEDKGYPIHRSQNGNKINTAWLIEKAGLKGKLLHGIRVSDKAPLVLINESATSYNDLAKARDEIITKVYDYSGFWLEQEPVELK